MENLRNLSPASRDFILWTPPEGRSVEVGPEHTPVPLPSVPLPLHRGGEEEGGPSDEAIGRGVYDYLRQFPDCPHNTAYAELLRDAFPYYLADLGAHAAMLDHKEVDAAYVERKIACLKILALLEPENPALLRQIGMAYFDLGTTFSELAKSRRHLLSAMAHLQRSLKKNPEDPTALNYLGEIDYLLGDYPAALRRWGGVLSRLEEGEARRLLAERIARVEAMDVPDHPLADDLEAVGAALEACGEGDFEGGCLILERLEEEGTFPAEMPSPEFFYLLGLCREKVGDGGGAFEAFERALELDPAFAPALEGREAILDGRRL